MTLLIVNADDYGLTEGVSRAVLAAHRQGVVTSTSVLTLAPGFARTVAWLGDAPGLGTGAHLAAVGEDPPLLSAAEVPSLVDRHGRLHRSWRSFLPACAAGRIDPDDLRREFDAQVACLREAGLTVDHLDTHQNIHLWPMVRDVVLDVGERAGVRVIRVTRSAAAGPVGVTVRRLAARLEARCDAAGWHYAAASTGLDEAGSLDTDGMVAALDRLAGSSSAELATHPGEVDDPDLVRYRWGYRWGEELAALRSPRVRDAIEARGFRLGTFADLADVDPAAAPAHVDRALVDRAHVDRADRADRGDPVDGARPGRRGSTRVGGVSSSSPVRSSVAARTTLAAYTGEGLGDRFHTRFRWWSAPLPAVEREVPRHGRVLEVGCGHGLLTTYLAVTGPARTLRGVDIDAHKVEIARRAAARLPAQAARPTFAVVDAGAVEAGPWDAVVIADVVYLLDPADRAALLGAYAAQLAPGGRLVVKEVDDRPRWKYAVMATQERLSTGVLGITEGETLSFPTLAELRSVLDGLGLDVRSRRLDRWYPWPHVLVVGTRRAG